MKKTIYLLLPLLFLHSLAAQVPRQAVVCGVDQYGQTGGLPNLDNAVSDAVLVAGELERAGFQISLLRNPTAADLRKAVENLPETQDIVFYFAGHGIQSKERNWLLGVDASLDPASGAVSNGIELGGIVDGLGKHKAKNLLVFLDCCRNLDKEAAARPSALRAGLVLDQYPGMVLCYAAAPGSVAMDGEGKNGPFAVALSRYIASNAELTQLLKNVTNEVAIKTRKTQIPYVVGSLGADFFFRSSDKNAVAKYREQLGKLNERKLESVATAMASLKELCQPADEPTRSLLIAEFVLFRTKVFELFNSENLDLLAQLAPGVTHPDESGYKKTMASYDRVLNQAGAWVRHDGEGGGVLAGRPMWLEGQLARLISEDWLEYVSFENQQAESPVADDASLAVSYGELLDRIVGREEFLVKHFTFPLRDKVEEDLEWHLKFFLYGVDNSPIADIRSKTIRPELLKAINAYIAKSDPVWQGYAEVRKFREILTKADQKLTPEVDRYAQRMFADRPIVKRLKREARGGADKETSTPANAARETGSQVQSLANFPGERFPQTRLRLLNSDDMAGMKRDDVQYAINELFARHGAWFPQEELRRTFGKFPWYQPRQGADFDAVEKEFSEIEKANLLALAEHRSRLK